MSSICPRSWRSCALTPVIPVIPSCTLATFYFTHKFDKSRPFTNDDFEEDAIDFVNTYGAYLDIYKCLKSAGKFRSVKLIKKLVEAARYDPVHKEAVKAIQKTNELLFYQPVSQCMRFVVIRCIT